jgi:alpha/beta hydrolase family protein
VGGRHRAALDPVEQLVVVEYLDGRRCRLWRHRFDFGCTVGTPVRVCERWHVGRAQGVGRSAIMRDVSGRAFVLVHSPLVGPTTWSLVAEALRAEGREVIVPRLRLTDVVDEPYWSRLARQVVEALRPELERVVLVGHSGAGLLLPVIGERLRMEVDAYIFVDATIPAVAGPTPVVPPEFVSTLREMATDGWLPRWSSWWSDDVMRSLIPDQDVRKQVESEFPSLPIAYFEESVPAPKGWEGKPCTYIQFSEAYQAMAVEASARGWPTVHLAGGHLQMLVDPLAVARVLAAE